jgi:hypothetical protein
MYKALWEISFITITVVQMTNKFSENLSPNCRTQVNTGKNVEAAARDFYKTQIEVQTLDFFVKTANDNDKFLASIENADVFAYRFGFLVSSDILRSKLLIWQKEHFLLDADVTRLYRTGLLKVSINSFTVTKQRWYKTAWTVLLTLTTLVCLQCIYFSCTSVISEIRRDTSVGFYFVLWILIFWILEYWLSKPAKILAKLDITYA